MAIINPSNGKVELAKVFDTHVKANAFDSFISKWIPDGYIVVATSIGKFTEKLSHDG